METAFTLIEAGGALIGLILSILFVLLLVAMPLLIILAIYKAAKNLMTHNAELKNKDWNDPQNR